MELVLSFNGSRGDIQPGVALAVELTARGHGVRMAVPPDLVDFAAGAGVDAVSCGVDTHELLGSDLVTRDLKSSNPIRRLRAVAEITLRGGRAAQSDLAAISTGADAIVGGSVGQERTLNVAQALGVPYVPVHLCPMRGNRSVSMLAQWGIDGPPLITRASWWILEQVLWQTSRRGENRLRADLGLNRAHRPTAHRIGAQGVPQIQAYDPVLFPGLSTEWGGAKPLVGYLNLSPSTRTLIGTDEGSADLMRWLEAGDRPVYVGFGSMTVSDPVRLSAAIIRATEGHRVLVAAGWSDFMADAADDRIHVVRTVDHDTVLPRCSVAVHHGGAGSTAAGLRAGLPTVVCWLGADQPLWGRQIARAGAGTTGALSAVTAESLRASIEAALTPAVADAARSIGDALIHPAAAVETAATIVESAARRRR